MALDPHSPTRRQMLGRIACGFGGVALSALLADEARADPALLTLHTGDGVFARPSMGAWVLYGLGSVNQNLPGFIVLSPSVYHGGAQNYGAAFLPASFQGTRIGDGHTPFKEAKLSNLAP